MALITINKQNLIKQLRAAEAAAVKEDEAQKTKSSKALDKWRAEMPKAAAAYAQTYDETKQRKKPSWDRDSHPNFNPPGLRSEAEVERCSNIVKAINRIIAFAEDKDGNIRIAENDSCFSYLNCHNEFKT